MGTWLEVIVAFGGGVLITILGNLLIPWYREYKRRPQLMISLRDDSVLAQNRQVIYHRLLVTNKGKTVARGYVAAIRAKNPVKENILEEAQGCETILKPDDFGFRPIL